MFSPGIVFANTEFQIKRVFTRLHVVRSFTRISEWETERERERCLPSSEGADADAGKKFEQRKKYHLHCDCSSVDENRDEISRRVESRFLRGLRRGLIVREKSHCQLNVELEIDASPFASLLETSRADVSRSISFISPTRDIDDLVFAREKPQAVPKQPIARSARKEVPLGLMDI